MHLTWQYRQCDLILKHSFGVAGHTRTGTPSVEITVTDGEHIGYGECSLPPYLGITADRVMSFMHNFDLPDATKATDALGQLANTIKQADTADIIWPAIAALDIALCDLMGKQLNQPLHQYFNIPVNKMPPTAFTISMGPEAELPAKMADSADFKTIKIKLGGPDDKSQVTTIRRYTDKPIIVDANQGWTDKHQALSMTSWLQDQGVLMIEQPMPKNDLTGLTWLAKRSPLPIFADESFQNIGDLDRLQGVFHGINIKLMKCGGITQARQIIQLAQEKGFKLMIGCMTETSAGIMAASLIAPYCEFADLDGCWLISNNPFELPVLKDGVIQVSHKPGLGLVLAD
jgi:L-Ala-D/L-Glu epimerase